MKTRYSNNPLAFSFALFLLLGTARMVVVESIAEQNTSASPTPEFDQQKRNVLLIIADDVGVDQIQLYMNYYQDAPGTADNIKADISSHPTSTPTINKLAAAGVTFVNAWSCPTCSPTRAGLFTGLYSCRKRNGVFQQLAPGDTGGLIFGTRTIADVLNVSGYTSGLFGKWHLGEKTTYRPIEFGWDYHAGNLGPSLESYYEWDKVTSSKPSSSTTSLCLNYATLENEENALDWIGTQTAPWMATLAFNAPHWAKKEKDSTGTTYYPYYEMPPSAYAVRTDDGGRGTFRSILEYLDQRVGHFLDNMEPSVLAKTTIIFMGDNGTEGQVVIGKTAKGKPITVTISTHFPITKNKGSLYEGGINVPLIIADGYAYLYGKQNPWSVTGRVVSPGRFDTHLVQTMDLFATIAEIGNRVESNVDSVSLVPYLENTSALPQRDVIFAEDRPDGWEEGDKGWDVAVRDSSYKLIVYDYGTSSEVKELYNLSSDRWELDDRIIGGKFLAGTPDLFDRVSNLYGRIGEIVADP